MKRTKTLAGGILGTIGFSLATVLMTTLMVLVSTGGAIPEEMAGFVAGTAILAAVSVLGLVMNILTIVVAKKNPNAYAKRKGVLITGMVCDILSLGFIAMYIMSQGIFINLFTLVVILALTITTTVLVIWDYVQEKARVAGYEEPKSTKAPKTIKRTGAMVGGILGTAGFGVALLTMVGMLVALMIPAPDAVEPITEMSGPFMGMMAIIGIMVIGLVMSIKTIKLKKKSPQVYKEKKGSMITGIVAAFLSAIIILNIAPMVVYVDFAEGAGVSGSEFVAAACALVAAGVFVIVDLAKEKRRVAGMNVAKAKVGPAQRRPLTLTGALIGLVGNAIATMVLLSALPQALDRVDADASFAVMVIAMMAIASLAIVGLIMNIVAIATCGKSIETYAKRRAKVITGLVFSFVLVVLFTITLVTEPLDVRAIILLCLIAVLLITGAIFTIVDMQREYKRTEKKVAIDHSPEFKEKITPVRAMRDNGMISDEEYLELKKAYIKKYLR